MGECFRPPPPYLVFYGGIEPADRIKAEGRIREHAWRAAYPFDRAASALAIQPLRTIADEGASIDNVEHTAGKIGRSEEHTSELQSLMRISYAVFCLKKKKTPNTK